MSTDPTNRNAAIHERPVLKLVKRMDEEHELRRTVPEIEAVLQELEPEEKAQPVPVRERLRMTWLGAPFPCSVDSPKGIFVDVDALRWLQHSVFKKDRCRSVLVTEPSGCMCTGRIYLISGLGDDFLARLQR